MGVVREEQQLESAFAAYKSAVATWRIASSARIRTPHVDDCAERLVRARVALYDLLTGTGWEPPHNVVVQLERDRALMALPADLELLLASAG